MRLNNNSTIDAEPLVMMERDLAEWYAGLFEAFVALVRARRTQRAEPTIPEE